MRRQSFRRALFSGVLIAGAGGILAGAVPACSRLLGTHETWTFWRLLSEYILLPGGVVLLLWKRPFPASAATAGMFSLGFTLLFFEARTLGFIVHDMGVAAGRIR